MICAPKTFFRALLFFLWVASVPASGILCLSDLAALSLHPPFFKPHAGQAQAIPNMSFPEGTQTFLLSYDGPDSRKGGSGTVYLVKPPAEPPYVLKFYRNETTFAEDLFSLRALAEGAKRRPVDFKIVEPITEGLPPLTMRLPYAQGRDLSSLLKDPNLPQELKNHLAAKYREALSKYYEMVPAEIPYAKAAGAIPESFSAHYGIVTLIFWISPPQGQKGHLMLKTTQVIVSPDDLSMTIVDPF